MPQQRSLHSVRVQDITVLHAATDRGKSNNPQVQSLTTNANIAPRRAEICGFAEAALQCNQYLYSQQSAEKKEKEIHYNVKHQKHNECSKYNHTAFFY